MLNEVTEEAETVNHFIFSDVIVILEDVGKVGLGASFDGRFGLILKDLNKLSRQLHDLGCHRGHFSQIFLDSLNIFFVELVVLLRL